MQKYYDKTQDKNFDDLASRFEKNIYDTLKGKIRLAVIERDIQPFLHEKANIIDAGGGQGQYSLLLAQKGHNITLCDISVKMLDKAKECINDLGLNSSSINLLNCPLQELPNHIDASADIVLCHAVLEWMAEPEKAIKALYECLNTKGILSLAFFNKNSIIFKNLTRGNYKKATSNNFTGMKGSLTPINPLLPEDVLRWCEETGFKIQSKSGIRVFHDYIESKKTRNKHPEAVIETELNFSRIEPYRSLGRYIHLICQKV